MKNNYFTILGIVLCLFMGCNSDDEDVKAVENMPDWFKIEDKPGEINHLIYGIYKDYGVTIFINDTLGYEELGEDAYGNPVVHTELFNMGYYVYGTYTEGRMRLSSDTAAMIIAVNMIKDRVIPYLPEESVYRPLSFLLADSILLTETISYTPVTREVNVYGKGLRGIVVGRLNAMKEMEQDELNMLGGEILAVKSADWILEFCVDELEDYYKITGEDQYGKTSTESPFSPAPKPEELGFIRRVDALISGRKYMKNPDRKQDIQDYVTVIYAYRGEESRFYELYSTYPKVIDKFKLMRPIVEKYEIANGIK